MTDPAYSPHRFTLFRLR